MAHLVESMAYVGETPWHGLGNRLTPKQPLEVWMREAHMDWEIREAPVCFLTGQAGQLRGIKSFDDHKVLYRSDTHEPLSVVSQRYKVVQPREVLEFYRDLTEVSGFELETAGVLKGGRKVWALARTGQSLTLKGNDVTRGYVLLATACDGTLATTAQFTSVRVVCNNTLTIAVNDSTGAVKVPHSTTFNPQAVKKQLGLCVSTWDTFMFQLKALSERRVKPREAEAFFNRLFAHETAPGSARHHERLVARGLDLFGGQGKGADLAAANGTAFGLLNAATQFVDHERRARSVDNRLDSAWFGHGAQIKQKAFDQAMALVS